MDRVKQISLTVAWNDHALENWNYDIIQLQMEHPVLTPFQIIRN